MAVRNQEREKLIRIAAFTTAAVLLVASVVIAALLLNVLLFKPVPPPVHKHDGEHQASHGSVRTNSLNTSKKFIQTKTGGPLLLPQYNHKSHFLPYSLTDAAHHIPCSVPKKYQRECATHIYSVLTDPDLVVNRVVNDVDLEMREQQEAAGISNNSAVGIDVDELRAVLSPLLDRAIAVVMREHAELIVEEVTGGVRTSLETSEGGKWWA